MVFQPIAGLRPYSGPYLLSSSLVRRFTHLISSYFFQVNLLTHTAEVNLNRQQLFKDHAVLDQTELFGTVHSDIHGSSNDEKLRGEIVSDKMLNGLETPDGGAVWEIFRRQDVPKLEEYLTKHHKEFRHVDCQPVDQVMKLLPWKLYACNNFLMNLSKTVFC